MKTSEELKKKLHDKEFAKLFSGIKSPEDIVKIAHDNGYDVSLNEVKNYELTDDMLENIAGGKMSQEITVFGNGAPVKVKGIVQYMDGKKK